MITIIDDARRDAAKAAFSVRNVPLTALRTVDDRARRPSPGDILLAEVLEPGRLSSLQTVSGRKSKLYPGDEVILVYGNRYAPDAYEAECPEDLGVCELAAAGGLAGRILETNYIFADEKNLPTTLKPIGIFVDTNQRPLNLSQFLTEQAPLEDRTMQVICVFGASMNAGKTTMAGGLIKGLTHQGLRVGAAKVTGTCSGGDLFTFEDAGAVKAVDFTDVGMATTYKECIDRVIHGAKDLLAGLEKDECDVAVVEIADGIFQTETARLLQDEQFRSLVDHWAFAADSATSVLMGLKRASELELKIRAVSGSVSAAPLAMREAQAYADAPILTLPDLWAGDVTVSWLKSSRPNIMPYAHPPQQTENSLAS